MLFGENASYTHACTYFVDAAGTTKLNYCKCETCVDESSVQIRSYCKISTSETEKIGES